MLKKMANRVGDTVGPLLRRRPTCAQLPAICATHALRWEVRSLCLARREEGGLKSFVYYLR